MCKSTVFKKINLQSFVATNGGREYPSGCSSCGISQSHSHGQAEITNQNSLRTETREGAKSPSLLLLFFCQ